LTDISDVISNSVYEDLNFLDEKAGSF